MDLEKAYCMISRNRVKKILEQIIKKGNLTNFVKSFLKERFIRTKSNSILSEKFKIENRVPQGSVLSVTLFLIAINDITTNITTAVKGCLFADDYTLFCSGKTLHITPNLLQNSLRNLQIGTEHTGFKF